MVQIIQIKILVIGLILAIVLFSGCSTPPVQGEQKIKIGALVPLSGNSAIYGESARSGAELAAGQINAAGGISGQKLEVVFEDSKGDAKEALSAFEKFENVPAEITMISGVVLAVAPLAEKQKIVLMNIGAKNPAISQAGGFVFSNIPNSEFDEKVFAGFVKNNLGISKVALLNGNNDYGIATSKTFEKFFTEIGGTIAAKESYENNATDFRTQLTKIKEANPEGIFLVGYQEQGNLLKQAYELGINAKWLAPEGFAQPVIVETAGTAAERVIYHAPEFNPDSNKEPSKTFFEEYRKKFGKQPDIYAANAYDAVRLFAQAIQEAGNNSEKIKEWLYNVKDWPSVTGNTSFDKNGDVIKPIQIMTVKNGEFVPYEN
ncbi:MAG: ABC transporter substrate-binding protein [Candidatus ainarchaeum sp.]|nr:ABC transporter substrate-binding protein [Candidatus ainarchaeum sp.]